MDGNNIVFYRMFALTAPRAPLSTALIRLCQTQRLSLGKHSIKHYIVRVNFICDSVNDH